MRSEIPSMSSPRLHERLTEIGSQWKGLGIAIECGSWFGASACALARGLVTAGYDRDLWLFDAWKATDSEVEKAAKVGVEIRAGENLMPACQANVSAIYPRVMCVRGRIHRAKWDAGPIEIFILDAAKRDPAFIHTMVHFAPHWIEGAVIGLIDFKYWQKHPEQDRDAYRCQERFVTRHAGYLEDMGGVEGSSARFFRVSRRLDL